VRDSEVTFGGLGKYLLIQCEIGYGLAKAFILLLQPFQFLELVNTHTAILLAPAIVDLLRDAGLTDRIQPRSSLANQDFRLTQLLDDFFWFVTFDTHFRSSVLLIIRVDQLIG
jgi:hypothetical protein